MFSPYLKEKILRHIFMSETYTPPATVYLLLFTANPTVAGAPGVEVSGGAYARQPMDMGNVVVTAATGNVDIFTTLAAVFTSLPETEIVGAALVDTLSGAYNWLARTEFSARAVPLGEDVTIAAGEVRVGM